MTRTLIAALPASAGTVAVYAGVFLNAVVGSRLGDVGFVLGAVLLGIATLPVKALPPNPRRTLLIGVLRYLSLPVFLLSAFMLGLGLRDLLLNASIGKVPASIPERLL